MTEEQGDAEFEASLAHLEEPKSATSGTESPWSPREDADLPPLAATGSDSTSSRLEAVHGTLSTLGMRIDALVTSTTSYRSALTDRLTEYSEMVAKATRAQAADLEEYRRTTERALGEVRRTITSSEESIVRVAGRVDELAAGMAGDDGESRRVVTEIRSILDAQERLSEFLTQSLDQFAETVQTQITATQRALAADVAKVAEMAAAAAPATTVQAIADDVAALEAKLRDLDVEELIRTHLEPVRSSVQTIVARDDAGTIAARVDSLGADLQAKLIDALSDLRSPMLGLRESLEDVASGEVVGALWDEVRSVRAAVEANADPDELRADLQAVRDAVEANALSDELRDELQAVRGAVEASVAPADLRDDIAAVRDAVAALHDDLAEGLEVAPAPAVVDALSAIDDGLAAVQRAVAEGRERSEAIEADRNDALVDQLLALKSSIDAIGGGDLDAVRSAIEGVHARLDEGLVLADDDLGSSDASAIAELTDQVASLRDLVSTELAGGAGGALSADAIDLLRTDIRDAAGVSDEVVDSLREELKALRRRVAVRATEQGLSDEDVTRIADAVVARLEVEIVDD